MLRRSIDEDRETVRKENMLKHSVTLGLVAATLSSPAWSQISVVIGIAPPPVRYELPPPPPAPSFIWVAGFWTPQGNHYRWIPGRYAAPPYPGAYWYGPHYEHGERGWGYRPGYWGHRDHDDDHSHGHAYAYGHHKDWEGDRDHGHDGDHGHDHGHGHDHDD
jgi:hypothetical protein